MSTDPRPKKPPRSNAAGTAIEDRRLDANECPLTENVDFVGVGLHNDLAAMYTIK